MATKDTGGQKHTTRRDEDVEEVEAGAEAQERNEKLDEDVDDILDEIDEVLESNAEDFVRQFVQKGGQ
ncbi:ubiquitin-like protein Pup [Nocardiopsis sp. RSe5-2]|uniref:Prokaryotic ubiquitin-like protein Pup n=1 Tax=Nocardiopsis endophytica TaxID=3018445 RepID=A0ABT4U904_9ACTN|nr:MULTISPECIES: ubiquitin-like protein Pup [Nocardiopsis]MDA2812900.1 ubiquitin-like protein Pup [Nocardiopsis endophytica]